MGTDTAAELLDHDFEGQARIQDGRPDIGADEYGGDDSGGGCFINALNF